MSILRFEDANRSMVQGVSSWLSDLGVGDARIDDMDIGGRLREPKSGSVQTTFGPLRVELYTIEIV